jgi:hypothetical protein
MSFEEQYQDVLQNIEFAIVNEYRKDRSLLDYDVADALEALIRAYRSEAGGRTPTQPRLDGKPLRVYEAVKAMCEWRLGRSGTESMQPAGVVEAIRAGEVSVGEIVDCLKRIEKSVHRWNKQNGRQGYLDFVSNFIL